MTSSRRAVRPYRGVHKFQQAIGGFRLRVTNREMEPGHRVVLQSTEVMAAPVALFLAPDNDAFADTITALHEACSEANVPPESLELAVVGKARRVRLAEVLWRKPLSDVAEEDRVLNFATGDTASRPPSLSCPHSGCDIAVYVALKDQLEKMPLRPWQRGTWLGRIEFAISSELGESGPVPIPLGPIERERLNLEKDALRFFQVDSALTAGSDDIEYYVDEDLLERMAENPHSPGSRVLQRELYIYAMSCLVWQASAELAGEHMIHGVGDLADSVIGLLLRRAAAAAPDDERSSLEDRLFRLLRDHPVELITMVEARTPGLKKHWAQALAGDK